MHNSSYCVNRLIRAMYLTALALTVLWLTPTTLRAESFARGAGGSYVIQSTKDFGGGGTDSMIMRIADDDINSWARTWGVDQDAWPNALAVDSHDAVYVAGNFPTSLAGYPFHPLLGSVYLLKYDSGGTRRYAMAYNWANFDLSARDICVLDDGTAFISGSAFKLDEYGDIINFAVLLKIDPSGNLVWAKRWAVDYTENYGAVTTDGNNVYCAGQWTRIDGATWAILLTSYNASNGDLNWAQAWEAGGDAWPIDLEVDEWGNLYVAGNLSYGYYPDPYLPGNTFNNTNVLLLNYTTGGSLLWSQHFGSEYADNAFDLGISNTGEIYIVGRCDITYKPPVDDLDSGDPDTDTLFLHYAANGYPLEHRSNLANVDDNYKECMYGVGFDPTSQVYLYGKFDQNENGAVNAVGGFWLVEGFSFAPSPLEDENCGMSTTVLNDGFESSPLGAGDVKQFLTDQGLFCGIGRWEEIGGGPGI